MRNYPHIKWKDDKDHLLFDIGYSTALLERLYLEFKSLADGQDLDLNNIEYFIRLLEEFRVNRLNVVEEIYSAVSKLDLPPIHTKKERNK